MSASLAFVNPPVISQHTAGPTFAEIRSSDPPSPISAGNSEAISVENREPPKTLAELTELLARLDGQFARFPVDDLRIDGNSLAAGGVCLHLDAKGIERLCEQIRAMPQSGDSALPEAIGLARGWAVATAQAHLELLPAAWEAFRDVRKFW